MRKPRCRAGATALRSALVLLCTLGLTVSARAQRAQPDTVRAGRFDAGKMWTFEYAPTAYFSETYGFRADERWFERARLAALRIPGCSASFVSADGLVVTNHHCARGSILAVQKEGEHLLDTGFYAAAPSAERRIPEYHVDQLVAVEDVSADVFRALEPAGSDSARREARRGAFDSVARRLRARYAARATAGVEIVVELVPLYQGGRYSAYVFRRYEDVRLVAAPEEQMGFFGGDPDNFTYPRYDLDFSFYRVYDAAGRPLSTPDFFRFSPRGVSQGDAVFVIGNPGPTSRGLTVAQLELQRDVVLPPTVALLRDRLGAMRDYVAHEKPTGRAADALRNAIFGISNSLKAFAGQLAALDDPVVMAKRRDAEAMFRAAVQANPELAQRAAGLFDSLAALQRHKATFVRQYAAFARLGGAADAALLRRAFEARRLLANPADTAARRRYLAAEDLAPPLEQVYLAQRLGELTAAFGANDPLVRAALQGRGPEEAARALLAGSALASARRAAEALNGGGPSPQDPALRLADAIVPAYDAFTTETRRSERREVELQEQLGRARFAVYGTGVPPDATSSPRIADGVVRDYEYNGTRAPWHTTFYGMYDRHHSFADDADFALPARWLPAPGGLDLDTPLDFISTADTFGGNSGSPAVTKELELVGLNFDRNVEGLSRAYIYLPERGQRNVMVDVRAIREALRDVYGAQRIVRELESGKM